MGWISHNIKDYAKLMDNHLKDFEEIDYHLSSNDNCPICKKEATWLRKPTNNTTEYLQICKVCKIVLSDFYEED